MELQLSNNFVEIDNADEINAGGWVVVVVVVVVVVALIAYGAYLGYQEAARS